MSNAMACTIFCNTEHTNHHAVYHCVLGIACMQAQMFSINWTQALIVSILGAII